MPIVSIRIRKGDNNGGLPVGSSIAALSLKL